MTNPEIEHRWTLHRLYSVARTREETSSERYGQALFNTLAQVRPDIAEAIRGGEHDPFYAKQGDEVLARAIAEIERAWQWSPNDPSTAPTEPMTPERLAEIRQWVASGEADNSDAGALLAEVDRLRAELSQGDAWLDATPDGQCRRVTERIDGVSVTREVDRRPVLAGTEGDQ